MKKYGFVFCLVSILLLGSSSCSRHYYYSPHSTHHTQLSDQGEITASAGIGKVGIDDFESDSDPKDNQYQVQAAYSPIKHLAVSSSLSFSLPNNRQSSFTDGYDADLAMGTYFFVNTGLDKQNREKENTESPCLYREEGFLFDAYFSYGRGRMINGYRLGDQDMFDYNRYGMQLGIYYRTRPSIGRNNTSFSLGVIVRPAILKFSDATIVGSLTNRGSEFLTLLDQNNRFRITEYTLTGQLGIGPVRLFLNTNWIVTRSAEFDTFIDSEAFQAGVLFEVDRLFNLNKENGLSLNRL